MKRKIYFILCISMAAMLTACGVKQTGTVSGKTEKEAVSDEESEEEESEEEESEEDGGLGNAIKKKAGKSKGGEKIEAGGDAGEVLEDYYYDLEDKYGVFDTNGKLTIGYGEYSAGHFDDDMCGMVNYTVEDLDGDGDDELLTIRIEDSAAILEIYEYDPEGDIDKTVSQQPVIFGYDYETDGDDMNNFYLSGDLQEFDVSIKDNDGDKLIAVDKWEFHCMYADGVSNELEIMQYDGDHLRSLFEDDFMGSDAEDYECAAERKELVKLGFPYTASDYSPFDKTVKEEEDLEFLFSVRGENKNVYLRDYYDWEEWEDKKEEDYIDYIMSTTDTKVSHEDFDYDIGALVDNGDFVFPDSDRRKLTEDELFPLSSVQIRIARNEIYARRGRRFNDAELQSYFNSKRWYKGTTDPDDFDEKIFNEYERYNKDLISEYESKYFN